MNIEAELITSEAFAPFGHLVSHGKEEPLAAVTNAFSCHADANIPVLEWVRPKSHVSFPTEVNRVERHPFSAQTFLPHKNSSFLVLVCESSPDGRPNPATAKAFIVPSEIGVTFARGIWHRSLAPLEADSGYTMAMMRTGRDDDTEFYDLNEGVAIRLISSFPCP